MDKTDSQSRENESGIGCAANSRVLRSEAGFEVYKLLRGEKYAHVGAALVGDSWPRLQELTENYVHAPTGRPLEIRFRDWDGFVGVVVNASGEKIFDRIYSDGFTVPEIVGEITGELATRRLISDGDRFWQRPTGNAQPRKTGLKNYVLNLAKQFVGLFK